MLILNENHKFKIDNGLYDERGKSIGLQIKRSDGVHIPGYEYFPKSVIKVKYNLDGSITVEIPEWIYRKKILSGNTIVEQ